MPVQERSRLCRAGFLGMVSLEELMPPWRFSTGDLALQRMMGWAEPLQGAGGGSSTVPGRCRAPKAVQSPWKVLLEWDTGNCASILFHGNPQSRHSCWVSLSQRAARGWSGLAVARKRLESAGRSPLCSRRAKSSAAASFPRQGIHSLCA